MNKKIVNSIVFILIFIGVIGLLHYFWVLVKIMNYYTSVSQIQDVKETINTNLSSKEEEKDNLGVYSNYMKEYNAKLSNLVTYYLRRIESQGACDTEIKNYKGIELNSQRTFHIHYNSLLSWSWSISPIELRKIIVCNIYNSDIQSLLLEIPYSEVRKGKVSPIIQNMIKLYSDKGYKINLLFSTDNNEHFLKHKNVISWLGIKSNVKIESINFLLKLKSYNSEELIEYYNTFKKLENFYSKNYLKTRKFKANFSISTTTSILDNKKVEIKDWFNTLDPSKNLNVNDSLILWETTQPNLNLSNLIEISESELSWINDLTYEIKNLFTYILEEHTKNKLTGKVTVFFNISHDTVKKIDWEQLQLFIKDKPLIELIVPNSISLGKEDDSSFLSEIDRIKDEYQKNKVLSIQDIELWYYKYKTLYLEEAEKSRKIVIDKKEKNKKTILEIED